MSALAGSYNYAIVILSAGIAVLAAWTSLDLAERVYDLKQDRPRNRDEEDVQDIVRASEEKGVLYRRRADVIGFVNGVPLLFMELKAPNRDLQRAYNENLSDYKDTIPHLFEHNAFIVLGNGIAARYGSLSSRYKHFREWKRLEEGDPGVVDMETLLKGICSKRGLLDIFENFNLFDDSAGEFVKIVAQNQQVLGVNRAIEAVRDRKERAGKLGVFWHTQGPANLTRSSFSHRRCIAGSARISPS